VSLYSIGFASIFYHGIPEFATVKKIYIVQKVYRGNGFIRSYYFGHRLRVVATPTPPKQKQTPQGCLKDEEDRGVCRNTFCNAAVSTDKHLYYCASAIITVRSSISFYEKRKGTPVGVLGFDEEDRGVCRKLSAMRQFLQANTCIIAQAQ